MNLLSERAIIYASQKENHQIWVDRIQNRTSGDTVDVTSLQSFVTAIFQGSLSAEDRNRVVAYLSNKGPEKLKRLFDKILQGKMLSADEKLSRVSKELKKLKAEIQDTKKIFNLYLQSTALDRIYQKEMATPLGTASLPCRPALSHTDSTALKHQMDEADRLAPSAIERFNTVVSQRLKLRQEMKDLSGQIMTLIGNGGHIQIELFAGIQDIKNRHNSIVDAYDKALQAVKEVGAGISGP